VSRLEDLLAAEHAAIYAYGVLGARLEGPAQALARAAYDAHRAARDDVQSLLRARGAVPLGPAPAYDVTVATAAEAKALAVSVEVDLGQRWHDLVEDVALRSRAVRGLQDSAVRAALWRRAAGPGPWTDALPGR
jgi:hypothetical protein